MTLFQLNSPDLHVSMALIKAEDALLLKRDACWLMNQHVVWPTTALYVLDHDVKALNLTVPSHFVPLSDTEWVELTLKYQQVVNLL